MCDKYEEAYFSQRIVYKSAKHGFAAESKIHDSPAKKMQTSDSELYTRKTFVRHEWSIF